MSKSKPKLTDWRKGPPPCEGWWNASRCRDPEVRRYWNGEYWGDPVYIGDTEAEVLASIGPRWLHYGMQWRGLAEDPNKKG